MALSHLSPFVRIFGHQGVSWIGKLMAILCKWDWGLKYDRVPYRNASKNVLPVSFPYWSLKIELKFRPKAKTAQKHYKQSNLETEIEIETGK